MEVAAPETKAADAPVEKVYPTDRPMGGPLARDDNRRTEHGKHPLDPEYNGTVVAANGGTAEAAAARVDAGLESPEPNEQKAVEEPTEAKKSGE